MNDYLACPSEILDVIKHTEIEYTFRMAFSGEVRPGQFFEVSMPKYGEAPVSVSGVGDSLLMRGPYGNGFDLNDYRGKELIVVAGGTGVSPVRGVIGHFAEHSEERKLCCGLGKCGHCEVGKTYICLDGPVFNYVEGKMLMD